MDLRVLHILPSARGYGAERQVADLLPLLQRPQLAAGLLTIYEPGAEERAGFDFPVTSAARNGRGDYLFLPRLVREIARFRPHIVHTHTHVGKYWGRAAALAAGVRAIVHTEHNPCDPRRTGLERVADAALHRVTARIVTFFAEQRTYLADHERAPIEKIAVIPNGVRADPLSERDRCDARTELRGGGRFAIALVGRMEFQKNHRLALEALAAADEGVRRRLLLHFIGAGEEEPRLRALTRKLDLETCVRFHGYRTDARRLIAGADLLLMTSWFEGMPLTLIEAMFAGVPILSTPWTGAASMLGNGRFGLLAPDWSAQAIAALIERAVDGGPEFAGVAARAAGHVRDAYCIERMALAHCELYAAVASEAAA